MKNALHFISPSTLCIFFSCRRTNVTYNFAISMNFKENLSTVLEKRLEYFSLVKAVFWHSTPPHPHCFLFSKKHTCLSNEHYLLWQHLFRLCLMLLLFITLSSFSGLRRFPRTFCLPSWCFLLINPLLNVVVVLLYKSWASCQMWVVNGAGAIQERRVRYRFGFGVINDIVYLC